MSDSSFENLDLACAKAGQAIAATPSKELEKLITNALGVLEEQGVYALFLFLKAQGKGMGRNIGKQLEEFMKKTLRQCPLLSEHDKDDILSALQSMSTDMDCLLLSHDLLRKTLVYARYHARLGEDMGTGS